MMVSIIKGGITFYKQDNMYKAFGTVFFVGGLEKDRI